MINSPWILPEGVTELLPPEAERVEDLRRRVIDLLHVWGYELVSPPLVEYLESLLTGVGNDLDLQTFKLTDQLSGRLMGLRCDMTPQVARIEAHRLGRDVPVRLCYLGDVLHTRPDGFARTRDPLQVGAELYGHPGVEADAEVVALMLAVLSATGINDLYLDLGHVSIFRALAGDAGLDAGREAALFDALQRKAVPEIEPLLAEAGLSGPRAERLLALVGLNGGAEVLAEARRVLAGAPAAVEAALAQLDRLADTLSRQLPGISLHFDLAELRGYAYHTGVVFAAYLPGQGRAIAQGGRYDGVGAVFGRARPATGFSTDLKTLARLSPDPGPAVASPIFAPPCGDADLEARVAALRDAGERVVRELPGQPGGPAEMGCKRRLVRGDSGWTVIDID